MAAKPTRRKSKHDGKASPSPDRRSSSTTAKGSAKNKSAEKKGTGGGGKDKSWGKGKKVSQSVAHEEMRILCATYPDAECELDFKNDFELLMAVILSAQTTDAQVNKVTPKLFDRFPKPRDLAEADLDEVKEIIRPTGYYNAKANSIQKCAQKLVEEFGGTIPDSLEELTTLPGVGRKTANVVLGVAHGRSAWTVDTHVQRLAQRIGLTTETDPYKIEMELQKLFPDHDWSKLSITLIWHGRRRCYARDPDCAHCPINHLCPSSRV